MQQLFYLVERISWNGYLSKYLDHHRPNITESNRFYRLHADYWEALNPKIMQLVARLGSRELFTLTVVAAAFRLLMVLMRSLVISMALGAFFAGMVVKSLISAIEQKKRRFHCVKSLRSYFLFQWECYSIQKS